MLVTRKTNSDVKFMLDNYEWIILPVFNVDGYEYTHTNVRRKSPYISYSVTWENLIKYQPPPERLPYKKDGGGALRKFSKEALRGTKILFCGRGF